MPASRLSFQQQADVVFGDAAPVAAGAQLAAVEYQAVSVVHTDVDLGACHGGSAGDIKGTPEAAGLFVAGFRIPDPRAHAPLFVQNGLRLRGLLLRLIHENIVALRHFRRTRCRGENRQPAE
jgi:hypothetical protein